MRSGRRSSGEDKGERRGCFRRRLLCGGFGDAIILGWCTGEEGEEGKMVERERSGFFSALMEGMVVAGRLLVASGFAKEAVAVRGVRRRWRLWSFLGCWSRWVYEEHERGLVKMEVLRRFGVSIVRRSRRPETVRIGEVNGERVV
ncbi:hypothetical protein HAX54_052709 [Datura stramonium]|uniref:Uncharacterized protein n=1 Tax=Datura stramonium TaxID=4076 RepID=A0ABS8WTK0_DATST|nr:hypothetical protein [Datura stramonium]